MGYLYKYINKQLYLSKELMIKDLKLLIQNLVTKEDFDKENNKLINFLWMNSTKMN